MDVVANVTTTAAPSGGGGGFSEPVAYAFVVLSVLFFGSNFVPVKKFETGDGVFFQWIACTAIWTCGLVLYGIRGFPTFHAIAMLGGFLWCTGNMTSVPIIKTIGLGQGILVWASFNLLSGWVTSRFGWFCMKPEVPQHTDLNYAGVALCFVSAFIYMFMKTNSQTSVQSQSGPSVNASYEGGEREPLLPQTVINEPDVDVNIFERIPPIPRRILGTGMAIVAGILYGLNFTPIIQFKDNHPEFSQSGLDYVFAHFCGIYVSSTGYFVIYCIVMRNKPRIYKEAILPGLVSGAMWGVAQIGWFIANDVLSEPISFPIITTVPAIIGSLWGIFFKEITGKRNFLILFIAVAIGISGSALTGLSKPGSGSHGNVTLPCPPK